MLLFFFYYIFGRHFPEVSKYSSQRDVDHAGRDISHIVRHYSILIMKQLTLKF